MNVALTLTAILFLGTAGLFAGTGNSVLIEVSGGHVSAHGRVTKEGVLVGGSVRRGLGLGSGGESVRICVISPGGRMISCSKTRVNYPVHRPIGAGREGTFATTVQAVPGSTIRIDRKPKC